MTTQPLFNPLNFVKIIAAIKPLVAATITYALNGIISYPTVAIKPEIIITITFINFLKSSTIKAKNVKGTAKLNPSFSGIIEPKNIPIIVVICHITQQVAPAPNE